MISKFKNIFMVVLIFVTAFAVTASKPFDIIGLWEGKTADGEIIKLKFLKNNRTELYKSKSGRINGEIGAAMFWPTYKIDLSTNPIQLDLVFADSDGNAAQTQLCIVKFIGENKIEIGFSKTFDKRATDFSSKEVGAIWALERK